LINWRRKHLADAGGNAGLSGVEDVAAQEQFERLWQEDHNQFLVRRALGIMQAEFEPTTWKACWEFVVNARPAAEVALELGISANAVFIAKCRVIHRLKQELEGLLDAG
jgi:RNA polymerase sigma-70 factor (ECF subfamily)